MSLRLPAQLAAVPAVASGAPGPPLYRPADASMTRTPGPPRRHYTGRALNGAGGANLDDYPCGHGRYVEGEYVTISVQAWCPAVNGEPVELTTAWCPSPGLGGARAPCPACGVCATPTALQSVRYPSMTVRTDRLVPRGGRVLVRRRRPGRDRGVLRATSSSLNWPRVCGAAAFAAASRGTASIPHATHKITLKTAPCCRRRWASARSSRRRWSRPGVHQGHRGHPGGHRRPCRCGVDGRHRRRPSHRRVTRVKSLR